MDEIDYDEKYTNQKRNASDVDKSNSLNDSLCLLEPVNRYVFMLHYLANISKRKTSYSAVTALQLCCCNLEIKWTLTFIKLNMAEKGGVVKCYH